MKTLLTDPWALLLNMSSKSKEKADFAFKAFTVIFLFFTFGGVVDVRKCVEALRQLPELQRMTEENAKDIKAIKEILVRHKLADSIENIREITTAKYE